MDFIPLTTMEYRLAVAAALGDLPNDTKRIIWDMVLRAGIPEPPGAPARRSALRPPSSRIILDKLRTHGRRLHF